jgi:hypothetical protein
MQQSPFGEAVSCSVSVSFTGLKVHCHVCSESEYLHLVCSESEYLHLEAFYNRLMRPLHGHSTAAQMGQIFPAFLTEQDLSLRLRNESLVVILS